ncbi:MAG: hydroxyethylthiazole kinase [Deltaproteobacteria bacterium]|nr:hydroxyethylthiazole kinase [Deltaproteobacteria bacterium]MBW2017841.1 hydroxyethylthiazole kinase [Deltaproteobacteria bacterium]MBW2129046.1 hydroxyethylthiazole kinase [Deltaproteobacteria bacterium]MBW2303045.1 hydroxyethylthiazole kinase [Deltaproteobacteria bacterium]
MQDLGRKAADNLKRIREGRPLVHNITNFVVMNVTANALLSCGASPVMAHAPEEVEEMVSLAGALVLNIGTLTPYWIDSMIKAGKKANDLGVPVVLDPVGSGATSLRTRSAEKILKEVKIKVIRGNPSEILSLMGESSKTRGVDSIHGVEDVGKLAEELASGSDLTIAVTGAEDLVTNGNRTVRVSNGHQLMGRVTGTGCMASAIIGAFIAVDGDGLDAAAGGLAYFGLAGEWAAQRASAPGSFQVALMDALFEITEDELLTGAKIREA